MINCKVELTLTYKELLEVSFMMLLYKKVLDCYWSNFIDLNILKMKVKLIKSVCGTKLVD